MGICKSLIIFARLLFPFEIHITRLPLNLSSFFRLIHFLHVRSPISFTEYEKVIDGSAGTEDRLEYSQPSTSRSYNFKASRRSASSERRQFWDVEHTTDDTDPQSMGENHKSSLKKFAELPQDATNWEKFRLLTWKNFLLQWRRKLQTVIEILVPVLFSALLVFIRSLVVPEIYPNATVYQPFPINNLDPLR